MPDRYIVIEWGEASADVVDTKPTPWRKFTDDGGLRSDKAKELAAKLNQAERAPLLSREDILTGKMDGAIRMMLVDPRLPNVRDIIATALFPPSLL